MRPKPHILAIRVIVNKLWCHVGVACPAHGCPIVQLAIGNIHSNVSHCDAQLLTYRAIHQPSQCATISRTPQSGFWNAMIAPRRIALMELGACALDNCSPIFRSGCASCNVSNTGLRCSDVMPESPPQHLIANTSNLSSKSNGSSGTNAVMPLGNSFSGRVWVERFLGSRNVLSVRSVPGATSAPSNA